jgi:hypothetical protein
MQELYDELMMWIEPELTSAVIPYLDELYKGETPEQAEERRQRYEKAFELCNAYLQQGLRTWKEELHALKNKVLQNAQEKMSAEERQNMADLDHSIQEL